MTSPFETQLMALIAWGELSGREVAQRYLKRTGKRAPHGSLYTTLRRLREKKLVAVKNDDYGDNRKRLFSLTSAGRQALFEARAFYRSVANME